MADVQNMTKRGGVYYVRFIIPKHRWQDVGRATAARQGMRRDIVRTLETRDHRVALQRRDAALSSIRAEVNAALVGGGLAPLHGHWSPSWGNGQQCMAEQPARHDPVIQSPARGCGGLSDRRSVQDTSQRQTAAVLRDEAAALGGLLDRWFAQLEGHVTKELIDRHHRAFARLGKHLSDNAGCKVSDSERFARKVLINSIDRRAAGHFREWLEAIPGVGPRVVANHLSTMNTFWKWAQDVGYAEANPWEGAARGIKRKIAKAARERGEKRPYTEAELISLIREADARCRMPTRWRWAPVISDMLRLGPLTGCRQNELASLTAARVIRPDGAEYLWRIAVTDDVGKTASAVREVPLHPIAQAIIARRLDALPKGHGPDARLFHECKPGGRDNKPGHYLSKRYSDFLKSVLGESNEFDFHSLRRCFATYFKVAEANGGEGCSDLVLDHLIGHRPMSLANNTYAAKRFKWSTYDRAILNMVEKGMGRDLFRALNLTDHLTYAAIRL